MHYSINWENGCGAFFFTVSRGVHTLGGDIGRLLYSCRHACMVVTNVPRCGVNTGRIRMMYHAVWLSYHNAVSMCVCVSIVCVSCPFCHFRQNRTPPLLFGRLNRNLPFSFTFTLFLTTYRTNYRKKLPMCSSLQTSPHLTPSHVRFPSFSQPPRESVSLTACRLYSAHPFSPIQALSPSAPLPVRP